MTSIYRRVCPEPPVSGATRAPVSQVLWASTPGGGAGPRPIWFLLPPNWRWQKPGMLPFDSSLTGALRASNGAKVLISSTAAAVRPSGRTVTRGVLGRNGGHFVLIQRERLWGLLPPWHELAADWPAPPADRLLLTLRSPDEGALRQLLPWLSWLRCGDVPKGVRPARRPLPPAPP